MKPTLLWTILVSLIDEAVAVAAVLWLLPMFGIYIPPYWLIVTALALGTITFTLFFIGNRTLMRQPVTGLEGIIGARGRVVSPLKPQGMVKIQGELWRATSEEDNMEIGEEITIVAKKGLTLLVRRAKP